MVGLTLARDLNELTMEELAEKLGVTKQSIFLWEKEGKIPEKRIRDLSKILRIPEDFLSKELNELDKLKIKKIQLQNEIDDCAVEIEEEIEDEETGEVISNTQVLYGNQGLFELLDEIDQKIVELNLKEEIGDSIHKSEMNYHLHKKFTRILQDSRVDKSVVLEILNQIKFFYDGKVDNDNCSNELVIAIKALDEKRKEKMQIHSQMNRDSDEIYDLFK